MWYRIYLEQTEIDDIRMKNKVATTQRMHPHIVRIGARSCLFYWTASSINTNTSQHYTILVYISTAVIYNIFFILYMLTRVWFCWDFVLFLFYCFHCSRVVPLMLLCVFSLGCFPCCPYPLLFSCAIATTGSSNARIWFVFTVSSEDAVYYTANVLCVCLFSFSVFDSVGSGAFRSTPSYLFHSDTHSLACKASAFIFFGFLFQFCVFRSSVSLDERTKNISYRELF